MRLMASSSYGVIAVVTIPVLGGELFTTCAACFSCCLSLLHLLHLLHSPSHQLVKRDVHMSTQLRMMSVSRRSWDPQSLEFFDKVSTLFFRLDSQPSDDPDQ